jgi:hypothetical protein
VDPALVEYRDRMSHRLRLIASFYNFFAAPPDDQATDRNTIVFRLHIACERKKKDSKSKVKGKEPENADEPHPDEIYINHEVLSRHLEWVPQGMHFLDLNYVTLSDSDNRGPGGP